jgi:hypothetical protein
MRRPGLPVVLSAVLSAIASGDGGSFSEGGSLLGLRSLGDGGGVDWRAGKWGLSQEEKNRLRPQVRIE